MPATQSPSVKRNALKKLKRLSHQLDAATDASETTTKKVRHARRTAETVEREVGLPRHSTTHKLTRLAAAELGRRGGAARARTQTRQQRSALALKAAKTRWKKH